MTCRWIVRDGTLNTFWAFTPCKKGFNYLSRINKAEDVKPWYDGRLCPICGKKIECNTWLIEGDEDERYFTNP